MANVSVFNLEGNEVGTLELNDAVFGVEVNEHLDEACDKAVLSARNVADVKTASVSTINVYDILKYNTVVATKAAVASIEEVYA